MINARVFVPSGDSLFNTFGDTIVPGFVARQSVRKRAKLVVFVKISYPVNYLFGCSTGEVIHIQILIFIRKSIMFEIAVGIEMKTYENII